MLPHAHNTLPLLLLFLFLVRLDDERAEVRMKVTPIGSPTELMNAFVEIRTATGGGVLEFAAKVVR